MVSKTSIQSCIKTLSQSENNHAIHEKTCELHYHLTKLLSKKYSIPISSQDPASENATHVRKDNQRLPIFQQQLITILPYLKDLSTISTITKESMNKTLEQENDRLTTSTQYLKNGRPIQSSAFLLKMASSYTLRAAMSLTQSQDNRATEIAFTDFTSAVLEDIMERRRKHLQQKNLLKEQEEIAKRALVSSLVQIPLKGLTYVEYDNLARLCYAFSNQEKNQDKQHHNKALIQPKNTPSTKDTKSKVLRLDFEYPSIPGVTQQAIYNKLMQLSKRAGLSDSFFNVKSFESTCLKTCKLLRDEKINPMEQVIADKMALESKHLSQLMLYIYQHTHTDIPVEFLICITKKLLNQNAENTKMLLANKTEILAIIKHFLPELQRIDQELQALKSHVRAKHGITVPRIRNSIEAYIKSIRESTTEILISMMQLSSRILTMKQFKQKIQKAREKGDNARIMLSNNIPRRTSKTLSRIITGVISIVTAGLGALIFGLRNKLKYAHFDLRHRHDSMERAARISGQVSRLPHSFFNCKSAHNVPNGNQPAALMAH